jgi:hypothetical protein
MQTRLITNEELRQMILNVPATTGDADRFFTNFGYLVRLRERNYTAALNEGLALLETCRQLTPQAYETIHKGTPYYWLGMAAFLSHDYQTATFFFDAGVSEDLRKGSDPVNNSTPGLRFIQIQGDQPEQAALVLVQKTQTLVERSINDYNGRPGCRAPLDLARVRERFLRRAVSTGGEHLRTLATAFISFFLEWEHRSLLARIRVGRGTTEPFFLHLFKGCLLFESLLKANPSKRPPDEQRTLGRVLQYLYAELGIRADIGIGGIDFSTILADLPGSDDSIPTAIEYAGKVRNTVGHYLGWPTILDAATYDKLAARIAVSCLHTIACLY